MPLQFRRGKQGDIDNAKLVSGEPCISTDSSQMYICFAPNIVKEIPTMDRIQTLISASTEGMVALEQLLVYLSSESVASGILASISTLSNNKLDKTGNSFLSTCSFTTASTESNIISGEKHEIIFGKLLKSQIDFRSNISSNLNSINTISNNIGTMSGLNTANTSSLVAAINSVKSAIDTTNNNLANKPAKPVTTSGAIGEFKKVVGGDNTAITLPSGGTWAYVIYMNNYPAGTFYDVNVGVAAGGTVVASAYSGKSAIGFIWRIS